MPQLETISKRLALASLLSITAVQMAVHPDATTTLRAMTIAAFVTGWVGARAAAPAWLLAASLIPAVLRLIFDREGPVLDMFWMAGLSALLLRRVSRSSWSVPPGWRIFAGGWALTVSLAWPVLVARETGFDPALLWDHGAINSSAPLSAPQAASWILYVAWMHLLGLLWLDWVSAEFAARRSMANIVDAMWIGVTLAAPVAIYQGTVDLSFLSTTFWAAKARATGTMLDANAYGMAAAIAGPVAFALLRERGMTAVGGVVLVMNLAGVWMSGARVPALGAGIGVTALLIGLWRTLDLVGRRHLAVSAVAGATALALIVLASDAIGPARRIAELPDSPRGVLSAAFNRPPYGPTAMDMIRDYPLSGVGIGSFQIFAADYWRRRADDALPFDSSQNWWRQEATELGAIGGLTLFVWSGLIAWTIIAAHASLPRLMTATVVRGVLIAIGICSIVQMPTHAPLVLLWFLFLLAWFVVDLRAPHPAPGIPAHAPAVGWAAGAVLAVAYAGTHVVLAEGSLNVAERARRMHRPYVVGTYPEEQAPDGARFHWTRGEARLRLPSRTPWVILRVWAHHPDIETRPVEVELSAPCGPVARAELKTSEPVSYGIELPPGTDPFDATIRVSRTWSPSDRGGDDGRDLGAGFVADFVDDRQAVTALGRSLEWPACP